MPIVPGTYPTLLGTYSSKHQLLSVIAPTERINQQSYTNSDIESTQIESPTTIWILVRGLKKNIKIFAQWDKLPWWHALVLFPSTQNKLSLPTKFFTLFLHQTEKVLLNVD